MDAQAKEDLALAIVLWKLFKQRPGGGNNSKYPTPAATTAGCRAVDLARAAGVFDEFMRVLTETPVMNLRVKELE